MASSLIAFCLFGAKLLLFYLTSLKEGLTFNMWVIIVGVNTSHVLLLPRKHFCVFPQKANEAIFDVFNQLGLDVGEVVRLVAKMNKLQIF